jgi:hypothetical protein
MQNAGKFAILLALLVAVALVALGCGGGEAQEVEVTRVVTSEAAPVEVTRIVEVTPAGPAAQPEAAAEEPAPPPVEVPFLADWQGSAHNRAEDEVFHHWDEEGEIEAVCSRCHSTPGYRDYLGVDGSTFREVDTNQPIGTTIECVACHNEVTMRLDQVLFPSGIEIHVEGNSARCMVCHQGRASTVDVQNATEGLDPDEVSEDLGFINIHYYAAAATLYGTEVKGGYEYEGKSYDAKFHHVEGYTTCDNCHNQHSLNIRIEECQVCHEGVSSAEDLSGIRMISSQSDYDGDGNTDEGILDEIHGLQDTLNQVMQSYASEVAGTAIVYDEHAYPYFFVDTNENGEADEDEANFGNAYASWTPRLLKGAYNYQVSKKDPGEFAHGGKYIIELLYDGIEDLNQALSEPIDMSAMHRIDPGHFAGSEEAFRHWDEEGETPASCVKCHTGTGLPFFLKNGVTIAMEPTNGLYCTTCHDSLPEFTRRQVNEVTFPSGATISFGEGEDSNLCIECHQGRESTTSVRALTEGIPPNEQAEGLRFLNVHYFAAGATLFGGEAMGGYQYEGREYVGRNNHVDAFNVCVECHSPHGLEVRVQACTGCHPSVENSVEGLQTIRMTDTDYDGDGNTDEGIAGEIATFQEKLYAAIQAYSSEVVGSPAIYNANRYPYFFADANDNGEIDEDEGAFNAWTPALLKAAYNYQYSQKDPGAFAHNGKYVIQLLHDSLADLAQYVDVDTTGLVRPGS